MFTQTEVRVTITQTDLLIFYISETATFIKNCNMYEFITKSMETVFSPDCIRAVK